ncbi:hypothetical protein CPLU01_14708 [Colletotrichum plurivorum]|uniref:Uncharacterized protein n=1 Tax=Colletotrichum plurivorum TaxID=2175906 RepID=A0A8H6JHT7_9PEZI|nr:hypothetical protein CPLU01_14708 [Colletotrichum plurivorum]
MVAAALVLLRKGEGINARGRGLERNGVQRMQPRARPVSLRHSCPADQNPGQPPGRVPEGQFGCGVVSRRTDGPAEAQSQRQRRQHRQLGGIALSGGAGDGGEKMWWWCCGVVVTDRRRGSGGGSDL